MYFKVRSKQPTHTIPAVRPCAPYAPYELSDESMPGFKGYASQLAPLSHHTKRHDAMPAAYSTRGRTNNAYSGGAGFDFHIISMNAPSGIEIGPRSKIGKTYHANSESNIRKYVV